MSVERNAEWIGRIGDHGRRADRTAFTDAFDTELVDERSMIDELGCEARGSVPRDPSGIAPPAPVIARGARRAHARKPSHYYWGLDNSATVP